MYINSFNHTTILCVETIYYDQAHKETGAEKLSSHMPEVHSSDWTRLAQFRLSTPTLTCFQFLTHFLLSPPPIPSSSLISSLETGLG